MFALANRHYVMSGSPIGRTHNLYLPTSAPAGSVIVVTTLVPWGNYTYVRPFTGETLNGSTSVQTLSGSYQGLTVRKYSSTQWLVVSRT